MTDNLYRLIEVKDGWLLQIADSWTEGEGYGDWYTIEKFDDAIEAWNAYKSRIDEFEWVRTNVPL